MEQYKAQGIVHLECDFMTTERKKIRSRDSNLARKTCNTKHKSVSRGGILFFRGRNWAQTEEGRRPHPRVPCPPDRPRAGDVFPPTINRLSDVESPVWFPEEEGRAGGSRAALSCRPLASHLTFPYCFQITAAADVSIIYYATGKRIVFCMNIKSTPTSLILQYVCGAKF